MAIEFQHTIDLPQPPQEVFATLADVTLPNATIQFPFTIVPSTSTVGVEAVVPGVTGNVGNNSIVFFGGSFVTS